jgi:hypothetical protein
MNNRHPEIFAKPSFAPCMSESKLPAFISMKSILTRNFLLAASLLLLAGAVNVQAANIIKGATTTMSASTDWNGTAPTISTLGEFGSQPNATQLSTMTLGANTSLLGLQFDGTGATPMAGPLTISAANTLTLGATGMVFQAGAPNVTLGCGLTVNSASQTWSVGSGQTLTINGALTVANFVTTISGAGTVSLAGSVTENSSSDGFGLIISGGTSTRWLRQCGQFFRRYVGKFRQFDGERQGIDRRQQCD